MNVEELSKAIADRLEKRARGTTAHETTFREDVEAIIRLASGTDGRNLSDAQRLDEILKIVEGR